jgi:hypothetical protein
VAQEPVSQQEGIEGRQFGQFTQTDQVIIQMFTAFDRNIEEASQFGEAAPLLDKQ